MAVPTPKFLAICFLVPALMILYNYWMPKTDNPAVVVHTSTGAVEGMTIKSSTGKAVDVFYGIPYATPPIGNLRFKPPLDVQPWRNIFQAKTKPRSCFQTEDDETKLSPVAWWVSNAIESEDCLQLNVWVPKPKPSKTGVLVWIHGGSFSHGSSAIENFYGQDIAAEEGLVVVTINYRLSVFGFLYLDHPDAPGNVGLMDQAKALNWVNQNIHHFGGDPNMVTLFGHSTGATSAALHLLNPKSERLFKNLILTGGLPWLKPHKGRSSALKHSQKFASSVGCPSNLNEKETILECLRKIAPMDITAEVVKLYDTGFHLGPVLDGHYFPEDLGAVYEKMVPGDKSILVGNTNEEGAAEMLLNFPDIFLSEDTTFTLEDQIYLINVSLGYPPEPLVKVFRHHYTDWDSPNDPFHQREMMVQFSTDLYFLCPAVAFLDDWTILGHSMYQLVFSHRQISSTLLPSWTGTFHGEELQFFFGRALNLANGFTTEEALLSRRAMRYIANFAKQGDPNTETDALDLSLPRWPAYHPAARAYLLLGLQPLVDVDLRERRCALLRALPDLTKAFREDMLDQKTKPQGEDIPYL